MRADATIVIPQFNYPELTARCVASLRRWDGPDWPILVVDDGSRPATRAWRALASDPQLTLVSCRHRGVTAAWNSGVLLAATPLVVLVNNDVVWTGPALAELLQPLRAGRAQLVGARWRHEPRLPPGAGSQRLLAGWCLALARDTSRRLHGFDDRLELYFSDTDFQLRVRRLRAADDPDPLLCVDVPLRHAGHGTTRALPERQAAWRRDAARFREKWRDFLSDAAGTA